MRAVRRWSAVRRDFRRGLVCHDGMTVSRRRRPRAFLGAAARRIRWRFAAFGAARRSPADDGDDQAEWRQSYETLRSISVGRESTPTLSPATVDATQSGDPEISGHRRARRLEHGPGRRPLKIGVEGPAGAGVAPAAGRLGRPRSDRRHGPGLRFLRRSGGQALPGPSRPEADRRRRRGDVRRAQCARRRAPAAAPDQYRPSARLLGRSGRRAS